MSYETILVGVLLALLFTELADKYRSNTLKRLPHTVNCRFNKNNF